MENIGLPHGRTEDVGHPLPRLRENLHPSDLSRACAARLSSRDLTRRPAKASRFLVYESCRVRSGSFTGVALSLLAWTADEIVVPHEDHSAREVNLRLPRVGFDATPASPPA
jgi:hypothetical protein